jgi:hypothetical protein
MPCFLMVVYDCMGRTLFCQALFVRLRQCHAVLLLLAAQHVQQVVFTHRLGQRQASVLATRVVEVRLVLL